MNVIENFVNGKKFVGESKRTSIVFNPATGEQTAEVKLATVKDVDTAVQAAKKAFISWSNKPPLQRARIMFKFKELIEKNSEELTKIIVSEHGKVFDDAKAIVAIRNNASKAGKKGAGKRHSLSDKVKEFAINLYLEGNFKRYL